MNEEEKCGNEEPRSFVKEFDTCPQCGCLDRFFETLGKELKERGLAKEENKFYYDSKAGPFVNQDAIAKLPIGGSVPAFMIGTDVCLNCGNIYAVRLERSEAKKTLAPVQMQPLQPNRMQRRHGGNGEFELPPHIMRG